MVVLLFKDEATEAGSYSGVKYFLEEGDEETRAFEQEQSNGLQCG